MALRPPCGMAAQWMWDCDLWDVCTKQEHRLEGDTRKVSVPSFVRKSTAVPWAVTEGHVGGAPGVLCAVQSLVVGGMLATCAL